MGRQEFENLLQIIEAKIRRAHLEYHSDKYAEGSDEFARDDEEAMIEAFYENHVTD